MKEFVVKLALAIVLVAIARWVYLHLLGTGLEFLVFLFFLGGVRAFVKWAQGIPNLWGNFLKKVGLSDEIGPKN